MQERSVSDYLSEWSDISLDDFLASLASDMRGDVSNIMLMADHFRTTIELGKPVEVERLQMIIDRILRRMSSLFTILDAVGQYRNLNRAQKSD
jgi:hypothetical protein